MSFLNSNNGEVVSSKLTKNGRKAIAKGSFNVAYFQIGDSEFDYTGSFNELTGSATHQNILAPFDKDGAIKYPFSLDSNTTTTYGVPVVNPNYNTTNLRNVMGPAGFVSDYTTSSLSSYYETKNFTLTGGTTLSVLSGNSYNDFVTVTINGLSGSTSLITGNTTSLTYKIISKTSTTLTVDRNLPNISGYTGDIIDNTFNNESNVDLDDINPTCIPFPLDSTSQLNSWTMNPIWSVKPIGADVSGNDESLNGYVSNRFVSAKNFFGYTTSSGQTFQNLTGGTITGTSFVNGNGDIIEVTPEEQRCILVLHYSELGDIIYDPEKYFKYDDFISDLTSEVDTVAGEDISDTEYFEIYIPFLYYHRGSDTKGVKFHMDTTDYYIKSFSGVTESNFSLKYRYLLDKNNNKVGKVFVNNKVVVFDDQEIVAALEYRSNRKYTLSAPKLNLVSTGASAATSLLSSTGNTLWVTYTITNGDGSSLNALPCNYYTKITGTTTPSSVSVKFYSSEFQFMNSTSGGFINGFIGKKFYILTQLTSNNALPTSNNWRYIDFTTDAGGDGTSYLQSSGITSNVFNITKTNYDSASSNIFDLENHMSGLTTNYLESGGVVSSNAQFGDEQPFPGSIKLVRASDVEEFNYLVNLPSGMFNKSQNPTYTSDKDTYFTEVALLDNSKNTLVIAKTPTPIKRVGAQVISVRLDF